MNKTVDIEGLEIYCGTSKGAIGSMSLDDAADSKFWASARYDGSGFDHLLQPFNMSVTLVV